MMLIVGVVILLLISFILAVRSAQHELSVPQEVQQMKIPAKNSTGRGGVILFLKEKIVHYSSEGESEEASSSTRAAKP